MAASQIILHQNDLPASVNLNTSVAIDTEAMGLNPHRDRLCLVQLSGGDGICHLVQINTHQTVDAPNLTKLLTDENITKIFHFARFDVALLQHTYNIVMNSIYCTKVASRLVRTYTDRHGLKELCRELLGVDISKEQQTSDWGQSDLTTDQQKYAASDVLYLHQLKTKLDMMLERESRTEIAKKICNFLPTCAHLDILGYTELQYLNH